MTVKQIFHLINSCFAFGKSTDQRITVILLSVSVVVLIYFKGRSGQLVFGEVCVHFGKRDIATHELVYDFDFDNLFIFGNVHFIYGFIQDKACRLLDFSYIPNTERNLLKRKTAIFF